MLFLKSILLVIPVIMILFVVVYLHIIMINALFKLILSTKECFSNSTKKASCLAQIKEAITEDFFLTKAKYRGKSILGIGFGVFFFLHFALFINYYQSYINDDTKYHDAKVYYVVGMVPHSYSVILGQQTTPLYPPLLGLNVPATKIKEYLFNQGVKLIPKEDGERELWEYEWFYYSYIVGDEGMWGQYVGRVGSGDKAFGKKAYDSFAKNLSRLYTMMEAFNDKPFADKEREMDAKMSFAGMSRYYFLEKLALAPYDAYVMSRSKSPALYLRTNPKMKKRSRQIATWLQGTRVLLSNSQRFLAYKREKPREGTLIEVKLLATLLWYLENNLMIDIHERKFACDNASIQEYAGLRKELLKDTEISALTYPDRNAIYDASVNNIQSEFTRKVLSRYCQVEAIEVGKGVDFTESMLDENDSVYAPEVKILNTLITPHKLKSREGKVTSKDNIVVIDDIAYENKTKYKEINWYDAKNYCEALNLDSGGWRLPTVKELEKISNIPLCGEIFGNDCDDWVSWFAENKEKRIRFPKAPGFFLREEFIQRVVDNTVLPTFWTSQKATKYWTAPSHMRSDEVVYTIDFYHGHIKTEVRSRVDSVYVVCVKNLNKIEGK